MILHLIPLQVHNHCNTDVTSFNTPCVCTTSSGITISININNHQQLCTTKYPCGGDLNIRSACFPFTLTMSIISFSSTLIRFSQPPTHILSPGALQRLSQVIQHVCALSPPARPHSATSLSGSSQQATGRQAETNDILIISAHSACRVNDIALPLAREQSWECDIAKTCFLVAAIPWSAMSLPC